MMVQICILLNVNYITFDLFYLVCGGSKFGARSLLGFVRSLHLGLLIVRFGAPACWLNLTYTVWLVRDRPSLMNLLILRDDLLIVLLATSSCAQLVKQ